MKLHELLPQAMLFVRGGNGGISHNPLESVTVDDARGNANGRADAGEAVHAERDAVETRERHELEHVAHPRELLLEALRIDPHFSTAYHSLGTSRPLGT